MMICWSTLGHGIHKDVTLHLNTAAKQVPPVMATIFSDGNGLFQKDNAPQCHSYEIVYQ